MRIGEILKSIWLNSGENLKSESGKKLELKAGENKPGAKKEGFSISFEFFPPKSEDELKALLKTVDELQETVHPTFISVTYGAAGTTRERTKKVVLEIARRGGLTVMAHLTCIAHSREELEDILREYHLSGIENLLVLRGDKPSNMTQEEYEKLKRKGCTHATELIKLIKEKFDGEFSIGVAAYPEKHKEAPSLKEDIKYLKLKQDLGAEFAITQMFFVNEHFYRFLEKAHSMGVNIPIVPGIMPITNFSQIRKSAELSGAEIPENLLEKLEKAAQKREPGKSREEIMKIGIEHATKQCEDLIRNGINGLHFFTLNRSRATIEIFKNIEPLIKDRIVKINP